MQPNGRLVLVLAFAASLGMTACKTRAKETPTSALPPGATAVANPTENIRNEPPTVSSAPLDLKTAPLSFAPIAKKADPSVVTIYTVGDERTGGGRRVGGRIAKGLGTGFIVQKDGVIITNNHV